MRVTSDQWRRFQSVRVRQQINTYVKDERERGLIEGRACVKKKSKCFCKLNTDAS